MSSKRSVKLLLRLMARLRDRRQWKWSGCGKIRHATMAMAQQHCRELLEQMGDELHPYRCKRCGYFHVGHRKGRGWKQQSQNSSQYPPPEQAL